MPELSARTQRVIVTWVKGHATEIDVTRARTIREDKIGNDGADEKIMLEILLQRRLQAQELGQGADRGSDMGDGLFADPCLAGYVDASSSGNEVSDTCEGPRGEMR